MALLERVADGALAQLDIATGRTFSLPLVVFFPTARCNSRCVSCNWWRASGETDLSLDEIAGLAAQLPALRTRLVLFSGGEPLLRREVFQIADLFRAQGLRLHLLTSGLFLERDADLVAERFEAVTVSLDGHTPALYRQIRGVDGLALVERGVSKLRLLAPGIPLRARATLHRHNYCQMPDLIDKARAMGLDQISFLAADVTSEAFGRKIQHAPPPAEISDGLLLDEQQVQEFAQVVEQVIGHYARDLGQFVAESPARLRRLPQYYAAQLGLGPFPPITCHAPWISAVIEADGAVRPCYFHPPAGNIRAKPLRDILENEMAVFRQGLDVAKNSVCEKCVCTLRVSPRSEPWRAGQARG